MNKLQTTIAQGRRRQASMIAEKKAFFWNKFWIKIKLWFLPYTNRQYIVIDGKYILIFATKKMGNKTYIVYDKRRYYHHR